MTFDRWWVECSCCHREYDLVMEQGYRPLFCCWCGDNLAEGNATNQSEAARRAEMRQRQTITLGKYLIACRSRESIEAEDAADDAGDQGCEAAKLGGPER